MLRIFEKVYHEARVIGGQAFVPPYNESGEMEGVPHVWTLEPEPKIIIFTNQVQEPTLYEVLPTLGFDTESHEYLTAKEFLKFYEDCNYIEFRPLGVE